MAFGVTHIVPILSATDAKNGEKFGFSAGTYIGSGAATAEILSTGLTKIHKVYMNLCKDGFTAATHNSAGFCDPQKAAGTPGSFYPTVVYIAPGAAVNYTKGVGAGATFAWLALGE